MSQAPGFSLQEELAKFESRWTTESRVMTTRHEVEAAKRAREKLNVDKHLALREKQGTRLLVMRNDQTIEETRRSRYHDHVEQNAQRAKDRQQREDLNRWTASVALKKAHGDSL